MPITIIEARKKSMKKLYEKYSKHINNDLNWALPYVWDVQYRAQVAHYETYNHDREEFICYTNDLAFAAMLFSAWILKEKKLQVTITSMQLSGMEENFTKICQ